MSRSRSTSCPTSTFFTSKTTCSIGLIRGGGRLMAVPCGRSLLGSTGGAAGRGDGDGEADSHEEGLLGRVGEGGDDADDLTGPVEQGAPGVARVHGGVELDQALQGRTVA